MDSLALISASISKPLKERGFNVIHTQFRGDSKFAILEIWDHQGSSMIAMISINYVGQKWLVNHGANKWDICNPSFPNDLVEYIMK